MVRFVNAFRLLAKQPEPGHAREDLLDRAIRFWPVGDYLILYLPGTTPIEIVGVVHGARDVPVIINRRF
jgi:plasmid stabilization system protein ParE